MAHSWRPGGSVSLLARADGNEEAADKEAEGAQGEGHLAEAGGGETYKLLGDIVLVRVVHDITLLWGATEWENAVYEVSKRAGGEGLGWPRQMHS